MSSKFREHSFGNLSHECTWILEAQKQIQKVNWGHSLINVYFVYIAGYQIVCAIFLFYLPNTIEDRLDIYKFIYCILQVSIQAKQIIQKHMEIVGIYSQDTIPIILENFAYFEYFFSKILIYISSGFVNLLMNN